MKTCIVGAGAIGGYLGAKLALAGEAVTLIARGPHLDAIRSHGLRLIEDGQEQLVGDLAATETIGGVGPVDVVILALKAHQIEAVAGDLPTLYDENTVVVTVQNGIPWWYFQRHGGPFDGRRLETLDPRGTIAIHVPATRLLGSIAYPATEKPHPGVIQHVEGNRFPIAELDGAKSDRAKQIADLLTKAGLKSRVTTDIRAQIWLKAWGNLSFNPISALTRATLDRICAFSETRALSVTMMEEAKAIAEELGITFRHTIEQRIAGAAAVGAHKTSMLQDLEAGRALEIEALIGAVRELGRLTKIPTPSIDAVYACVKLLDVVAGAPATDPHPPNNST